MMPAAAERTTKVTSCALSSRPKRYENSMWVSACRWPKLIPFINVVGEPELGRVGIAGYIEEVSRVAPKSETLYKV
jgi:hypothetical protein